MLSVNQRSIKSHRLLLSIFVKIWTHFTIQDEIDAKGVILDDVYSDVIGAEGDAGVDDIDVNVDVAVAQNVAGLKRSFRFQGYK